MIPAYLGCAAAVAAMVLVSASADAITFSADQDTFVKSDDTAGTGADAVLRIKHEANAGGSFHRKAYHQFDISSRTGRRIGGGQLDLPFVDSGAGGVNGTPNFDFQVYGLTNQSLEPWDENVIKWSDPAPGNDVTDGNLVNPADTTSVGTFSVTGKGVGTQSVAGGALASFLNADNDGFASFITVRDTRESGATGSYVHGIQSKEAGPGAMLTLVEDNFLTNGELEDGGGSFSDAGWTNGAGVASGHGSLVDGSQAGAFLDSTTDGILSQGLSLTASEFMFDVFFATTDGGGGAGDRGFNVLIDHDGPGQLNLRVNGQGEIQAFDGSWQTLADLSGLIAFSDDANGSNDFTSPGDTQNVHHLRILGHQYGTPDASYDVFLSGANDNMFAAAAQGVQFWQGGAPSTLAGQTLTNLEFSTAFGNGDFAIDAVYLQDNSVPEPMTAVLGLMGLAVVGARRRRAA